MDNFILIERELKNSYSMTSKQKSPAAVESQSSFLLRWDDV